MRIKIIGDNNCARATRHLLRLAGFAVTEFLPAEAVTQGPHAGYAITIDLAPATHTPDASLRPDHPTQGQPASAHEEAPQSPGGASSPAYAKASAGGPSQALAKEGTPRTVAASGDVAATDAASAPATAAATASSSGVGFANAIIHFDSVDAALEAAVLRHVTQLAAAPVIVDRPGGIVHSERELRIIAPNTGDAKTDEAAAVAIEFGVLRGLLDLTAPVAPTKAQGTAAGGNFLTGDAAEASATASESARSGGGRKKWWPFGVVLLAGALTPILSGQAVFRASTNAAPRIGREPLRLNAALAALEPQGQFATGQGFQITDGTKFLVVDPCKAQTKLYVSISQTSNTQLVAGTASKKIYVCSIHVVVGAATNVALVEGTGTACGTSTTGVSGFGGATAASGWNFAANGGITLGNGDSSLGAEGTSGDNLCLFNSGSGQVSGGISYVVE